MVKRVVVARSICALALVACERHPLGPLAVPEGGQSPAADVAPGAPHGEDGGVAQDLGIADVGARALPVRFRITPDAGVPGTLVRIDLEASQSPGAGAARFDVVELDGVRVPLSSVGPGSYIFSCPLLDGSSRPVELRLVDEANGESSLAVPFGYYDLAWAVADLPPLAGTEAGEVARRTMDRIANGLDEVAVRLERLSERSEAGPELRDALVAARALFAELAGAQRRLAALRELDAEAIAAVIGATSVGDDEVTRALRALDVMLVASNLGAERAVTARATTPEHALVLELDAMEAVLVTITQVAEVLALGAVAATVVPAVAPVAGPSASVLFALSRLSSIAAAALQVIPTNLALRSGDHLAEEGITLLDRIEACPGSEVFVTGRARFIASRSIAVSALGLWIGSGSTVADSLRRTLSSRLPANTLNVVRRLVDFLVDRVAGIVAETWLQDALVRLSSLPGATPLSATLPVASADLEPTFQAVLAGLGLRPLADVLRLAGVDLTAHRSRIGSSSPTVARAEPTHDRVTALAEGVTQVDLSLTFFSERSVLAFFSLPHVEYGVLSPTTLEVRSPCCSRDWCSAGVLRLCAASGAGETVTACPGNVCRDGESCWPSCVPGTRTCVAGVERTCDAAGQGQIAVSCATGACSGDRCLQCPTACAVGAARCAGGVRELCVADPSGCTAWTMTPAVEVPNYLDDDCDGRVDEDFRVVLWRRQASNGRSYLDPLVDADHCFSTSPVRLGGACVGAQNPRWSYDRDDQDIAIYGLATALHAHVTPVNADVIALGPHPGSVLLARLAQCYDSARTEHQVWTTDSAIYANRVSLGWPCVVVGYVKTGSPAGLDPSEITVRDHRHVAASDWMYDVGVGSAAALGFVDHGPAWFAWMP